MTVADDQLARSLSILAVPAPEELLDRVMARWAYLEGPVENVYVAFTAEGISSVVPASTVDDDEEFVAQFHQFFGRPLVAADRPPDGVEEALHTGRAVDLAFDLRDRTPFEQDVLYGALRIPPGEVRPYSWIAAQIDRPKAVRAVGTALGHNPIPILIPCHRVVRADGSMGQYGFGPDMKRRLLDGEGVDIDQVETMVRSGFHYVGDESTRVVCMPTCHRLIDANGSRRRGFRLLAEAIDDGFRPCKDCRPVGR